MKNIFIYAVFLLFVVGFFSCNKNEEVSLDTSSGKGGSLARFTIQGNYLYTVDEKTLTTYDISDPKNMVQKDKQHVAWNIETIFPYDNNLFIGGQVGMYIYDISHPASPKQLGKVEHLYSCDPVVANDSIAFVTLRSGSSCGVIQADALYIYNIKNKQHPEELTLEKMDGPEGLGLQDSILFVCDHSRIVVFNVKNPDRPVRVDSLSDKGEIYHDVIPYNDLLISMVDSGILLYDIANLKQIKLVGQITYQ